MAEEMREHQHRMAELIKREAEAAAEQTKQLLVKVDLFKRADKETQMAGMARYLNGGDMFDIQPALRRAPTRTSSAGAANGQSSSISLPTPEVPDQGSTEQPMAAASTEQPAGTGPRMGVQPVDSSSSSPPVQELERCDICHSTYAVETQAWPASSSSAQPEVPSAEVKSSMAGEATHALCDGCRERMSYGEEDMCEACCSGDGPDAVVAVDGAAAAGGQAGRTQPPCDKLVYHDDHCPSSGADSTLIALEDEELEERYGFMPYPNACLLAVAHLDTKLNGAYRAYLRRMAAETRCRKCDSQDLLLRRSKQPGTCSDCIKKAKAKAKAKRKQEQDQGEQGKASKASKKSKWSKGSKKTK